MNVLEQLNVSVNSVTSEVCGRLSKLNVGDKVAAGVLVTEISSQLNVDKVLVQCLVRQAVTLDPGLESRQGKNGGIFRTK